ncbi:MAG: nitronate monooxygenase [Chloroflexota bacterium]|nr:MAG: nitronate monooxygenase [Chloroflexota bacterium]
MWETRVTRLLGCKYPLIQGAYHSFGRAEIAAAVSNTGAFGIITAGALRTPERVREEIARARQITDKPFGVNITLSIVPNPESMLDAILDAGVRIVFTAANRPEALGRRIHEAGAVWVHKVATVRHAMAAEKAGADAVVIVGIEGAGHKNPTQVTTLINIPLAVRNIRIPIIAAGGIGDARGFMSALSMGAEAAYVGTAFIATEECPAAPRYKQLILDGWPYDARLRGPAFAPPDAGLVERMRRGETMDAESITDEDFEGSPISSLPSLAVGLIDQVVPVQSFVEGIIGGAEEIRRRWAL